MFVKPKKSLGQHFLKDKQVAEAIAGTVDCCPGLPVLEVGAGKGALTQFLIGKGRPLKVVELDREAVRYLRTGMEGLDGTSIIEGDFLKMDLKEVFGGGSFVLTGNYPYNISNQIFFKLIDNKDLIPCCTGMVQKEVAERITAGPGRKSYGILSVLLGVWYDAEYIFTVDEDVFIPPPKVKSAVIRLTRNKTTSMECNERLFKQIVKTTFNQRRKTIKNSIKPLTGEHKCDEKFLSKRPEQLSVDDFIELTNQVEAAGVGISSSGATQHLAHPIEEMRQIQS